MTSESHLLLHLLVLLSFVPFLAFTSPLQDLFDPTTRDFTTKCERMANYAQPEKFCEMFELCCVHDPLNGDRCQSVDRKCVQPEEEDIRPREGEFGCRMFNCTPLITTTTTTTTTTSFPDTSATSSLFALSVHGLLSTLLLVANGRC